MHYYSHHIGDYRRDTSALSLAEHGAYRLLMDEYYVTQRPLPVEASALYRICAAITATERQAVKAVVARFFTATDGALTHKRVTAEIEAYEIQAEINRVNGKKGGRPPKPKPEANPPGFVSDAQPDSEREPIENPIHDPVTRSINPSAHAPPSEAEVLAYAANGSTTPIPPDCALRWLTDRETSDWQRPKGLHMLPVLPNWQADLRGYAMDWNKRLDEQKHRQNQPKNTHGTHTPQRRDSGDLNRSDRYA